MQRQYFNNTFSETIFKTKYAQGPNDTWGFDPNNPVFLENCKQALKTGEPGFSFNFGDKQNETLRNACD